MNKEALFLEFIRILEVNGVSYAILGRYTEYPKNISSDLDIVIFEKDRGKVFCSLEQLSTLIGVSWVNTFFRGNGIDIILAFKSETGQLQKFNIDIYFEFRVRGRVWISADEFLKNRFKENGKFYVPSIDISFKYYFLKRVFKKSLGSLQCRFLAFLYNEDRESVDIVIAALNLQTFKREILYILSDQTDKELAVDFMKIESLLSSVPSKESFVNTLCYYSKDFLRFIKRLSCPSGFSLALLGPDGSGKSTLSKNISDTLSQYFRGRSVVYHFRPTFRKKNKVKPSYVNPYLRGGYSIVFSQLKVLYLFLQYCFGYFFIVRLKLTASTLVLFDRYFDDTLVDPMRVRIPIVTSFHKFLVRLCPSPDLWIFLRVDAETLVLRKDELSLTQANKLNMLYHSILSNYHNFKEFDANKDLGSVLGEIVDFIIKKMSDRNRHRVLIEFKK